ncbi:hypothetical protein [Streptomyces corynorhini]|uniref:hypothetical protein n=1 Tax=Streptomyces corynorhini TaxID=2282652 RepID=UPI001F3F0302|nr:hypothetical protein [Streptomyces corynorhini]
MEPVDADGHFGKVPRGSPSGTRLARVQALSRHFLFLELRHKVEIHRMTGRVVTEALVRVLAGRARTIGVASPGEIFDTPTSRARSPSTSHSTCPAPAETAERRWPRCKAAAERAAWSVPEEGCPAAAARGDGRFA